MLNKSMRNKIVGQVSSSCSGGLAISPTRLKFGIVRAGAYYLLQITIAMIPGKLESSWIEIMPPRHRALKFGALDVILVAKSVTKISSRIELRTAYQRLEIPVIADILAPDKYDMAKRDRPKGISIFFLQFISLRS
ncbi:MAG: hypothetical protein EZS28_041531 [Streblomastix strix]|uniref:Uncharacterized protein n=1 Tax=Streblomastix strix TaxID=222440 RepID=A0A5J4TYX4_9EUKA|nr:MAG: hypothetical protein EZS28_041531 [Streblomastix strix]